MKKILVREVRVCDVCDVGDEGPQHTVCCVCLRDLCGHHYKPMKDFSLFYDPTNVEYVCVRCYETAACRDRRISAVNAREASETDMEKRFEAMKEAVRAKIAEPFQDSDDE